jgi:hypothetical protein
MNHVILIYKILILIFFATTGLFFHQWNLAQNQIEDLKKQILILNREQQLLHEELINKSVVNSIPIDVITTNDAATSTFVSNLVDACIVVGGGIIVGLLFYTVLQSLFGGSSPSMSSEPTTTNQVSIPSTSTPAADVISETSVKFVEKSSELINNVVQNSLSQSMPCCVPTTEVPTAIRECLELIWANPSNLSLISIEYGLGNQCYANLFVNNPEIIELVQLKLKLAGFL